MAKSGASPISGQPLARGALVSWKGLIPGVIGIGGRVRTFVEQQRGRVRLGQLPVVAAP